ncbi:MAG: mechanosensitive ion channel family protein [Bacteroidetes bacterium]|nr:mechanosensitive ion channel family protein [Bacteroidota bacterium]MBU1373931.1 mechanosensitive ion channel family protein [Bacteroidota bacterium]MBU1485536.1 mechanosensitive ion channel family protein [Bacteroidota bacterium]MBU1761851.1 mechanosensitive ion channel family protein [Bacteroidota bacterium]MBU2269562.1 mechanosensitive ion channel family protein [Bacteroidota bacterium]
MQKNFSDILTQLPDFIFNLIILCASIVLGMILKSIILRLTRYYRKIKEFSFIKSTVLHLGKPLNFFLPFIFLNIFIPLLRFPQEYIDVLNKSVELGLIVSFSYILINLINVVQDFVVSTYDLKKKNNLRERKIRTQLQFLKKFLVAFIVVLTIAAILFSFEGMRKIGAGLLTGVGVGGIIIGIAAQKSLSNLLAGFQIAFTQPIRIDDVLIVEGEWGKVEEITLTYVVIHIWDDRRLILPINYFIEKPFQNWTRISSNLLGTVFLYVDYTLPIDKLREEYDRILSAHPLWDKRTKIIQVTDSKERVMEVRALMSARNASDAFDLRCDMREGLISFIQNNYPNSLPKIRADFGKKVIDKLDENH